MIRKPPERKLDSDHRDRAAECAKRRLRNAKERGLRHRYSDGNDLKNNFLGAQGEIAASLEFDLPWTGEFDDRTGGPDIGDDVDIRTRSRAHYQLDLFADSKPDWRYVLVTGEDEPLFRFRGWLFGREGMQSEFDAKVFFGEKSRNSREHAKYLIPQEELRHCSTFGLPIITTVSEAGALARANEIVIKRDDRGLVCVVGWAPPGDFERLLRFMRPIMQDREKIEELIACAKGG